MNEKEGSLLKEVLNVEEAAEYLNISVQTVLKLANEGSLPAARIGKQWRFSRRQLLEHIEGKAV